MGLGCMIQINNCNNIDVGELSISKNHLNVKYAFNGTGKSTISNAIISKINNDDLGLSSLTPFKCRGDESVKPSISGLEEYRSVKIFNDDYIEQYFFQQDELVKDSFEIFVRTPDYDSHMQKIEQLVKAIHDTYKNDDTLNELITDLQSFIDSYGKGKTGPTAGSVIGKGLGKGNKLSDIPEDLSQYKPFLIKPVVNVKWLKWQLSGNDFLVDEEICPYCAKDISHEKESINKVGENFDSKVIDSLNKILEIFGRFKKYFSDETNLKIDEISNNISEIKKEQKMFLKEVYDQTVLLKDKLVALKNLGYVSLEDAGKVKSAMEDYKIDLSYLPHLNSKNIKQKVKSINDSVDLVLDKVGELEGEVNKQRALIKKTIEKYKVQINEFLEYAGYRYCVSIDNNDGDFKLKLYHRDYAGEIPGNEKHLSYGEKNAFALALFMYSVLHENPDLIILDDPISSFDNNKRFAIINMLFMGSNSLKDRTVLLFTHEFSLVVDMIYNFKSKILPTPLAHFLSVTNCTLSEQSIKKEDIMSFVKIAENKINGESDTLNKLIYLRRLFELRGDKGYEWNLLSCLFHKKNPPTKHGEHDEEPMTTEEIQQATKSIQNRLPGFDFDYEMSRVNDVKILKRLYAECTCNYEKLQIFRIIFEHAEINDVVRQYINETYHIENDYLFQLDPAKYNTVPSYIIDICDKVVAESVYKTNEWD